MKCYVIRAVDDKNPGRVITFRKNEYMEYMQTLDEAEEYYRLQIKPWGFTLLEIVQLDTADLDQ